MSNFIVLNGQFAYNTGSINDHKWEDMLVNLDHVEYAFPLARGPEQKPWMVLVFHNIDDNVFYTREGFIEVKAAIAARSK